MKYDCSICGKKHEIYFGINSEMSQNLMRIIEENSERVIQSNGIYLINKSKVIMPSQITIKTAYREDFFYQTWVECDAKDFIKFSEEFKNEIGGKIHGELFDDLIPIFPNTKKLKCIIEFPKNMKSIDFPSIIIVEDSDLKNLQDNTISKIQLEKLMDRIHHSNIPK